MTNGMADIQDLYIERANPADPTQFADGDQWTPAQVIEEVINIRRGQPHVEQVVITHNGPLITGLLKGVGQGARQPDPIGTMPLALRWTGQEPSHNVRAILRLNRARNWDEFSAALADWATPPQNVLFADDHGNIGYRLVGRIPKRAQNLGLVPAPGWEAAYRWQEYIAPAELPSLYNPPSGKIVSANHKTVGDDYPYFLGAEFAPGWRAARAEDLLNQKERHTIRDMEEMQLDTYSNFAHALTPWLTLLNSEDPWEKAALGALRRWNFQMDSESSAALIFHFTVIELLELIFGDKLGAAKAGYLGIGENPLFQANGFLWRAETRLLELLNEHESSYWYTDARTGRQRSREELLQEALSSAVKKIRAAVGDSMRTWNWGRVHQIRYVHPLGSARLLRNVFNRGPLPIGGDAFTLNVARFALQLPLGHVLVAASYRQIFEVGSWDRAQSVTNVGQSGHPLSDLYDDQIMMWKEGAYHAMPWSREAVDAAAVYRLTLQPPT
jgi:penicillin amidase